MYFWEYINSCLTDESDSGVVVSWPSCTFLTVTLHFQSTYTRNSHTELLPEPLVMWTPQNLTWG
jgi:hypothetical protein